MHQPRRLAELLVPHGQRCPKRRAVVARRRLDVDLLERRLRPNLAVRDAVHRAPACQAEPVMRHARMGPAQDMEGGLLEARLQRGGEIFVVRGDRILRPPGRPEQLLERGRPHVADDRRALVPLHQHLLGPVPEVLQRQRKAAARRERHEAREAIGVTGGAVRRQPHDLVLVAVVREAQVLRERQVEQAERVREEHAVTHVERRAPSVPDRRADEVAKPVDRADRRLVEPARVERTGEVCGMVLDETRARRHVARPETQRAIERATEIALSSGASPVRTDEPPRGRMSHGKPRLPPQVRAGEPRHGEPVDVLGACAGHAEARVDRVHRHASRVLEAGEPFLFEGGDQDAVVEESRRHVAVIGVEPEDQHGSDVTA
jgi:hypothetical protein